MGFQSPLRFFYLLLLILPDLRLCQAGDTLSFFVPSSSYSLSFQQTLEKLVSEFNQTHTSSVKIHFKGTGYSSLTELTSALYAGDRPDIAFVDIHELHQLQNIKNHLKPPPQRLAKSLHSIWKDSSTPHSLPMIRATPVLLIDQEKLFRQRVPTQLNWKNWKKLETDLFQLSPTIGAGPNDSLIAGSFQSHRGLLLLEAIAGEPFSQKKALLAAAQRVQSWLKKERTLQPGRTEAQSIESFLQRSTPALFTHSDRIPYLLSRSQFRWKAIPLHQLHSQKKHAPLWGANLIFLSHSDVVRSFVRFLYLPKNAIRWSHAAGSIPVDPKWKKHHEWKHPPRPRLQESLGVFSSEHPARWMPVNRFQNTKEKEKLLQKLSILFGPRFKQTPPEKLLLN